MSELKHTDFMKGLTPLLKKHLPSEYQHFRLGETRWYFQVYYGKERNIHYEVNRPTARCGRMLEIGLHFEVRNAHLNAVLLREFMRYILEIREALGDQVVAEAWDRGWTKVYEAYPSEALTLETQTFAAQRLTAFITTVQPIYEFIAGELKV